MQINRLFEIVYILLDKKTTTAKKLSEHFEVSTRTIYRDIEILSGAGIPVFMSKGKGGGISLIDKFVLNKSVLSENEQNDILSALQSLNIINYPDIDNILSKLSSFFNKSIKNWIEVDFSDWSGHEEKFNIIKNAIFDKKIICFDYFSTNGEKTKRKVEPFQLWFKEKNWYLKAFCREKQSLRVFKLTRITMLQITEETFDRVLLDNNKHNEIDIFNKNIVTLKLNIDSSQSYRVYDEFEEEQIIKNANGSFDVEVSYPENEWVYSYILSFGYFTEVIEPIHIREIIKNRLKKTLNKYL